MIFCRLGLSIPWEVWVLAVLLVLLPLPALVALMTSWPDIPPASLPERMGCGSFLSLSAWFLDDGNR